jgi:hypothetical protein
VHFLESEIEALDPREAVFNEVNGDESREARSKSAMAGQRGRKTSHTKWAALIAAVVQLDREKKLNSSEFSRPKDLRDEIQVRLEDHEQFDDRHIDPVVSYIYKNLLIDDA